MIDWSFYTFLEVMFYSAPVDAVVFFLVWSLKKNQGKLNAMAEMTPDISKEDREEMKAYAEEQIQIIAEKRREERARRVYFLEGKP